ncbi:MAG: hypothetical protein ACRDFQ_04200 [Anaerolineales bacterium]
MGVIWPWERKKVERELQSVENLLESAFQPVSARPDFISSLRKKLVGKGALGRAGLSTLEVLLLISGAILGTFVFVFSLIRSIVAMIAGFRLIRRPGKERAKEPAKKRAE